jgi:hypothetical protein
VVKTLPKDAGRETVVGALTQPEVKMHDTIIKAKNKGAKPLWVPL